MPPVEVASSLSTFTKTRSPTGDTVLYCSTARPQAFSILDNICVWCLIFKSGWLVTGELTCEGSAVAARTASRCRGAADCGREQRPMVSVGAGANRAKPCMLPATCSKDTQDSQASSHTAADQATNFLGLFRHAPKRAAASFPMFPSCSGALSTLGSGLKYSDSPNFKRFPRAEWSRIRLYEVVFQGTEAALRVPICVRDRVQSAVPLLRSRLRTN